MERAHAGAGGSSRAHATTLAVPKILRGPSSLPFPSSKLACRAAWFHASTFPLCGLVGRRSLLQSELQLRFPSGLLFMFYQSAPRDVKKTMRPCHSGVLMVLVYHFCYTKFESISGLRHMHECFYIASDTSIMQRAGHPFQLFLWSDSVICVVHP